MNIFLSPHLDDICFSSFLAIKEEPKNSCIINVFNKSCWNFLQAPDKKKADLVTKSRKQEELLFGSKLGVNIDFLGLEDSSLRHNNFGDEYEISSRKDQVFSVASTKIAEKLEQYTPLARIYVPLGISYHVDHLICRDVILQRQDLREKTFLYEDLPYIASFSEEDIHDFVCDFDFRLTPLILKADSPKSKITSMSLYQSQLESHTISKVVNYGLRLGGDEFLAERYWKLELSEDDQ
ncbi:MAG: PIG-L family deacetylase [Cyanobacteria bacterium P01_C01_bin.70]